MGHRMRYGDGTSGPSFDVPPRFAGLGDRRAAGRIAARWSGLRGAAAMPAALRYAEATAEDGDGAGNDLMLDLSDRSRIIVTRTTLALTAVFGVATGSLLDAGPSSLARAALAAVDVARRHAAPVPFEAALSGDGWSSPTLLTRGVLLPLVDACGDLVAAHVVVTWKQLLSEQENRRLERELWLVWRDFSDESRLDRAFGTKSA